MEKVNLHERPNKDIASVGLSLMAISSTLSR